MARGCSPSLFSTISLFSEWEKREEKNRWDWVFTFTQKKEVNAVANGVSSAGSGIKYRLGTVLLVCTLFFPPKATCARYDLPKSTRGLLCVLRCLNQNHRRPPYVWAGTRDLLNVCLSVRCNIHVESFDVLVRKYVLETCTCALHGEDRADWMCRNPVVGYMNTCVHLQNHTHVKSWIENGRALDSYGPILWCSLICNDAIQSVHDVLGQDLYNKTGIAH